MEDNKINIIVDDDNDDVVAYNDVSDRIFELRDQLSLDIITRNIIDRFDNPSVLETPNYVTKFKENYFTLKDQHLNNDDMCVLVNSFVELSRLISKELNTKFSVGIGDDLDVSNDINIEEYMDKIETLYEFFVVRRYTYVKEYFKNKLLQNKIMFVEKYKALMDSNDKSRDDLFLTQDKKKYKDISDVIIIHYINDIIDDIKSSAESGCELFKDIAEGDLFEVFNNKMYNLILNYGNDFMVTNDKIAAESYLSILKDPEIYINLRNDLLSIFLADASLNEKYLNE